MNTLPKKHLILTLVGSAVAATAAATPTSMAFTLWLSLYVLPNSDGTMKLLATPPFYTQTLWMSWWVALLAFFSLPISAVWATPRTFLPRRRQVTTALFLSVAIAMVSLSAISFYAGLPTKVTFEDGHSVEYKRGQLMGNKYPFLTIPGSLLTGAIVLWLGRRRGSMPNCMKLDPTGVR